jgi:hypothetical protein
MYVRDQPLTPEQIKANEEAAKVLQQGLTYKFNPAVKATGIPAKKNGKPWRPQVLAFSRGYYLGYIKGQHVFRGKPLLRPANMPADQVLCFFHVDFIGGVTCTPDLDQQSD